MLSPKKENSMLDISDSPTKSEFDHTLQIDTSGLKLTKRQKVDHPNLPDILNTELAIDKIKTMYNSKYT